VRLRRAATVAVVLGVLVLAGAGVWRAAGPAEAPSLRERVDAVAATLRCPSCQGLSLEDSTSVLAAGSRRIIERQLEQGRTPDEIRQWFVDRYGPSVLLTPQPGGAGLLAWFLPGLVLLAGGTLVWRWLRRAGPGAAAPLDDDAAAALAAWRAGRLTPDDTPAGEELRRALQALASAEGEAADAAREASRRLEAAYRRYSVRPVTGRGHGAAAVLPRRAVTAGAVGAVLVAAGLGIAVAPGSHGGSASAGRTGLAAAGTAATGALPAPPPGWRGGMPRTVDQWVALGRAYDRNRQLDQAVAAYTMALRLRPGDDGLLLLRADVLVRSGKPAQALPDLTGLDARHPGTPDVLLVLGLAQNRTGAPQGDATLRRFLELAPDSPAAPGVRHLLDGG
jgi:cytochrome c-type biogenesis protein CcmH